jgi:hypothetical protein
MNGHENVHENVHVDGHGPVLSTTGKAWKRFCSFRVKYSPPVPDRSYSGFEDTVKYGDERTNDVGGYH